MWVKGVREGIVYILLHFLIPRSRLCWVKVWPLAPGPGTSATRCVLIFLESEQETRGKGGTTAKRMLS